jgi:hypothetical protein
MARCRHSPAGFSRSYVSGCLAHAPTIIVLCLGAANGGHREITVRQILLQFYLLSSFIKADTVRIENSLQLVSHRAGSDGLVAGPQEW